MARQKSSLFPLCDVDVGVRRSGRQPETECWGLVNIRRARESQVPGLTVLTAFNRNLPRAVSCCLCMLSTTFLFGGKAFEGSLRPIVFQKQYSCGKNLVLEVRPSWLSI